MAARIADVVRTADPVTKVREVRVTELTHSVFFAQVVLSDGTTVNARPCDALVEAPIDPLLEPDRHAENAHVIAHETIAAQTALSVELAPRNRQVSPEPASG